VARAEPVALAVLVAPVVPAVLWDLARVRGRVPPVPPVHRGRTAFLELTVRMGPPAEQVAVAFSAPRRARRAQAHSMLAWVVIDEFGTVVEFFRPSA